MKKLIVVITIFCAVSAYSGTTYHVAADSTYSTIAQINALSLVAGDSVLFKCGETFRDAIVVGYSGTAANRIVFGSFGTGAKPIISGSVVLSGWVQRGDLYAVRYTASIKNLYVNGVEQTRARTPNSNRLWPFKTGSTKTSVICDSLTEADDYWNGGSIRARTNDWAYEVKAISNYDSASQTITCASFSYTPDVGNGFFLDNVFAALDTVGEWYYDGDKDTLFYYGDTSGTIEGTVEDWLVYNDGKDHIVLTGLEFRHYDNYGAWIRNVADSCYVTNCNFGPANGHGIYVNGALTRITITGDSLTNLHSEAIWLQGLSRAIVRDNYIKNIGLRWGYGLTWPSSRAAINHSSTTLDTIEYNTVDSIGARGAAGTVIQYNYFKNTMLALSDGSAIYAYSKSNGLWQYNIIENVVGDTTGVSGSAIFAPGIYLDNNCSGWTIQYNTVKNATGPGIYLSTYGSNNTVYRNTFVNAPNTSLINTATNNNGTIYVRSVLDSTYGDHYIVGNICYPPDSLTYVTQFGYYAAPAAPVGTIDSNYYFNPYGKAQPFSTAYYPTYTYYGFAGWKSVISGDAHSTAPTTVMDSLFINTATTSQTFKTNAVWQDVDGNTVGRYVTVGPFQSRLLNHIGAWKSRVPFWKKP